MRVLVVAPVEQGSGETITCLHLATNLTASGHQVLFLASQFASRFLSHTFGDRILPLGPDGRANKRTWDDAIAGFRPDVVLFGDYPLLFFTQGASALAKEPGWQESLQSLEACLVTLDHFGFAQEEMGFFFGPPHLGLNYQHFPAIPSRMRILLPCPMHEPGPVSDRRGVPFRYWDVPIVVANANRQAARMRYLERADDVLIFHSVPNWAWQQAQMLGLRLHAHLGALFEYYFAGLPRPVTIVSVNNGQLLQPPASSTLRFVNLEPLPPTEFEELMFAADLVLTENGVSISTGKAVCGMQTCAAFRNTLGLSQIVDGLEDGIVKTLVLEMERERPGTIFPFHVYPAGMVEELKRIVLFRDNSLTGTFRSVEIFGGPATREQLRALLCDADEQGALAAAQEQYIRRLAGIDDAAAVLQKLLDEHRRGLDSRAVS